jgi:hypothetical protein
MKKFIQSNSYIAYNKYPHQSSLIPTSNMIGFPVIFILKRKIIKTHFNCNLSLKVWVLLVMDLHLCRIGDKGHLIPKLKLSHEFLYQINVFNTDCKTKKRLVI